MRAQLSHARECVEPSWSRGCWARGIPFSILYCPPDICISRRGAYDFVDREQSEVPGHELDDGRNPTIAVPTPTPAKPSSVMGVSTIRHWSELVQHLETL